VRQVWEGEFDCTVADSNIVDINRRYFPELIAPFNLSREQPLAWAMPPGGGELEKAVNRWLQDFEADGRLAVLLERYYGFVEAFDYVDVRVYLRRIEQRFPRYQEYFREAAEEYGLPPLLLAAQGYQESHWNPRASSPTGVRGIMMLTRPTARAMGVDNRLDPRQSIFGGARYLARMKERFVEEVKEPDRTWLALAAYNIGRAHLHDAQTLARQQGLNPYLWRDIKQVLPLLSQKKYYKKLRYGYARGMEPVRYVQRIREYQHILREQVK
jgi:membrane-bound lytic murein transglycosylase F